VFSRSGRLMAQPFDPGRLALTGEAFAVPLAGAVASMNPTEGTALAAGANGLLVWKASGGAGLRQLAWMDRDGKKLSTVGGAADYTNPALAPGGRRLAIGRRDPNTKTRDIWVFDLARGTNTRLTFDAGDDLNPLWSPDGTRLAFTSDRKGERDIWWKMADGSGQDELVYEAKGGQKNIEAWSGDGRYLVYNYQPASKPTHLWALPLTGERKPLPLIEAPYPVQYAAISPDSRWLAYTSRETGRNEVYVTAFQPGATGGKWQISSEGGEQPSWRGDGREMYFMRGGQLMAVQVKMSGKSFEAGIPRALFEVAPLAGGRNRFVPSADGQRFLMVLSPEVEARAPFEVLVNWTSLLRR
jgi:dipeptidyl aminopeptidase/acylaminoacyl peptidase